MNKIVALTMTYNETDFLPIWLKYYSSEIGIENCIVIDHGSDDGSTKLARSHGLIPLPRTMMDDEQRSKFVSDICRGLLRYYDWVIYGDADEILVPDPRMHNGLLDFCMSTQHSIVRAFGLNVVQTSEESKLDVSRPVLEQRSYVRFGYAMCKPVLTSIPVEWTPGFHSADQPAKFDSLYMFHLAPCDHDINMRKLQRTRTMPWVTGPAGSHQRVSDLEREAMLCAMGNLTREENIDFNEADPSIASKISAVDKFFSSDLPNKNNFYVDLQKQDPSSKIWKIPSRFAKKV